MPAPGLPFPSKPRRTRPASVSNGPSRGGTGPKKKKVFQTPNSKLQWALFYLRYKNQIPKMIDKLKSRKLWAAIVGSVILSFGDQLGLSPDVTQWIGTIVTGYIVGQGIADAGQGFRAAS